MSHKAKLFASESIRRFIVVVSVTVISDMAKKRAMTKESPSKEDGKASSSEASRSTTEEGDGEESSFTGSSPDPKTNEGVIYLGHIPHGFYEDQMRAFFKQFGTVKRLRLSRSKKTGRSRGYAFIQFDSKSVAEVVVKSMNKYILCDKVLECKLVEPEKVHPRMFAGAKRVEGPLTRIKSMKLHNAARTREREIQRALKLLSAEEKRRKKLKALDIDYEFPGYKSNLR